MWGSQLPGPRGDCMGSKGLSFNKKHSGHQPLFLPRFFCGGMEKNGTQGQIST